MTKMTILFAAAMTLASFGCKKKGSAGEEISKLTTFKDQMCACKDATCAQKVSADMTTWSQNTQKNQKEPPKQSDEEQKKVAEITRQLTDCMTKAMGTSGSAAGSAAEGSAAGSAAEGSAAGSAAEGSAAGSAEGSAAPAEGSAEGSAAPAEGSAAGSAAPADKKGEMEKK